MEGSARTGCYEIRVRGYLGELLIGAFPGVQVRTELGVTVLSGLLMDQAALYGVLAGIEGLGLELLEVRATDAGGDLDDGAPTR